MATLTAIRGYQPGKCCFNTGTAYCITYHKNRENKLIDAQFSRSDNICQKYTVIKAKNPL